MDRKDEALLGLLLSNSRQPFSSMAKQIGVSKEVVAYRYKRMQTTSLKGCYAVINYAALGFRRYLCFIQLKGISPEKEKEFLDYLNNHPNVTYMGPIIGKWNIAFDLLAKDDDIRKIMSEILNHMQPYLDSYTLHGGTVTEEIFHTKFFPTTNFFEEQQPKKKTKYLVDELDKKILSLLAKNARIEYKDLSRELNLTANAIKYRIKKLERENILLGYTAALNYTMFGYEAYVLQIKLTSLNRNKILNFLRAHKQVFFLYRYLGHEKWDIDVGLFVKSSKDIREFILELKEKFGELLKIHDMYIISDVIKDNVAPSGLFRE